MLDLNVTLIFGASIEAVSSLHSSIWERPPPHYASLPSFLLILTTTGIGMMFLVYQRKKRIENET